MGTGEDIKWEQVEDARWACVSCLCWGACQVKNQFSMDRNVTIACMCAWSCSQAVLAVPPQEQCRPDSAPITGKKGILASAHKKQHESSPTGCETPRPNTVYRPEAHTNSLAQHYTLKPTAQSR